MVLRAIPVVRETGYAAAASRAGFTRSEQASVSLIEERLERIEAGLDGIWVNHCDRLDAAMANSLRLCRTRSLRFCHLYEFFRATRLFRLGP